MTSHLLMPIHDIIYWVPPEYARRKNQVAQVQEGINAINSLLRPFMLVCAQSQPLPTLVEKCETKRSNITYMHLTGCTRTQHPALQIVASILVHGIYGKNCLPSEDIIIRESALKFQIKILGRIVCTATGRHRLIKFLVGMIASIFLPPSCYYCTLRTTIPPRR